MENLINESHETVLRQENISVCMATFNGSKYIVDQIDSVLKQLIDGDELIIIDDSSRDNTLELINSFKDSRIFLHVNINNLGVCKTFEKAIKLAKNRYIFLADQDDIWTSNRVISMIEKLQKPHIQMVAGNSIYINNNLDVINFPLTRLSEKDSNKRLKNLYKLIIGKAGYFGCCIAFRSDLKELILPFPNYIESHDLWITKASIISGRSTHLDEIVLLRRIHGNNASIIDRPLKKKIWSRILYIFLIIQIMIRLSIMKIEKIMIS